MKLRKAFLFLAPAMAAASILNSCKKCEDEGTVTFDGTMQYLSVEYKYLDTAGVAFNYLTTGVMRPGFVHVFANYEAGRGDFTEIGDDFTDGKFGPIAFTALDTDPLDPSKDAPQKMRYYDFYFIMEKDTFKADTFRVEFLAQVDECHEYWDRINYWKNNVPVDMCTLQEICEISIVE